MQMVVILLMMSFCPKGSVEDLIEQVSSNNPTNNQVIIHADRDASYQSVATIVDICNRERVASYRILVAEETPNLKHQRLG